MASTETIRDQEVKKDINVFISYSWTTPSHETWVLDLASRLDEHEGIHVSIDKWDLKTGNDVVAFMERMANDEALIDKVIIVLEEGYVTKANKRIRGVGTEAQIISPEVYKEINQDKFIPVVRERDEEGNPFMPIFLRNRKYIDFTKDGDFETAFEGLLRDIINRPQYLRPGKRVSIPAHILNDSRPRYKTTQIANGIDSLLSNRPQQLNHKIREFLDEFDLALEHFEITITDTSWLAIGKQIIDRLDEYTQLRDELLLFFDKIIKSSQEFDIDLLVDFFGNISKYTRPLRKHTAYNDNQFDLYVLVIHELFLSLVALALKNGEYALVAELLYSNYNIKTDYGDDNGHSYKYFYKCVQSIDLYYKQLSNRDLLFPHATLLYDRASDIITKPYLLEADLICYHIGEFNEIGKLNPFDGNWFPLTYIYKEANLDFFKRIVSKRYFEKVKEIYAVDTPQELVKRINEYQEKRPSPDVTRAGPVNTLYRLINVNTIATER